MQQTDYHGQRTTQDWIGLPAAYHQPAQHRSGQHSLVMWLVLGGMFRPFIMFGLVSVVPC